MWMNGVKITRKSDSSFELVVNDKEPVEFDILYDENSVVYANILASIVFATVALENALTKEDDTNE